MNGKDSPVLAPRALDGSSVDELSLKLNDGHGGVLVRVELDESESSVGLHPDLDDVAVALQQIRKPEEGISIATRSCRWKRKESREKKRVVVVQTHLEERDKVGLGGVGDEVSDVDGSVEDGSLGNDDVVAQGSTLEVDRSGSTSSTSNSRSDRDSSRPRSGSSGLSLLLERKMKIEKKVSSEGDRREKEEERRRTWLAQLTRIAREPSHSPFMVAIACSASVLSLKARNP